MTACLQGRERQRCIFSRILSERASLSVLRSACDNREMTDNAHDPADAALPDTTQPATSLPDGSAERLLLGWREWVGLPELGVPAIKAKIDTGARTSALHALDIVEDQDDDGDAWVSFTTQPVQRNTSTEIRCRARVVDKRQVTDSGGHAAVRYVVRTSLVLGGRRVDVELTLADRRGMLFRMLVGRTSLIPDVIVDPGHSFLLGRQNPREHYVHAEVEGEADR